MDKLNEYIENMKFKKRRMGGLDEEDVLSHIKKICEIVREDLAESAGAPEEKAEENAEAPAGKEQPPGEEEKTLEEQNKKLLEDQKALREELQKSQDACRVLNEKNEELKSQIYSLQNEAERTQREYGSKYRELTEAVDTLHKVKEDLRRELRASVEAEKEKMLAGAERERRAAESEIERLREEIDGLKRKKQAVQESIRSEREQWKQHLDWFASRLGADGDKAPAEPRRGYYSGYEADENGV